MRVAIIKSYGKGKLKVIEEEFIKDRPDFISDILKKHGIRNKGRILVLIDYGKTVFLEEWEDGIKLRNPKNSMVLSEKTRKVLKSIL